MNDIIPPPRRPKLPGRYGKPERVELKAPVVEPVPQIDVPNAQVKPDGVPADTETALEQPPAVIKKRRWHIPVLWSLGALGVLALGAFLAAFGWYQTQLAPASDDAQVLVEVEIPAGTSPSAIGALLAEKTLIRSAFAFDVYTNISGVRSQLQAGTYRLSPAESTPEIVAHIVNGRADQFQITFLPGATLDEHKQVLLKAGFSADEIASAMRADYDSPLFADKPVSADLEGYIYGETYSFGVGATVEEILSYSFDEYYKTVQELDLIAGFKAQGLTLYQGITLASIVQREALTYDDMRQVAQVFLLRLERGIQLGSDVTYQYIADKLGVARDTNLNNPYNTRRFTGLPPGPIASPGDDALRAVADPAAGDFLYFLSGDDDVTYFAHTEQEHQANIDAHCQIKCSTL